MTAYARSLTAPQPLVPYLTADEYRQAPTGVDASALVANNADANLAELNNVIGRATSWVDQICNQVLAATADTESGRLPLGRDGVVRVHPRHTPIGLVTAFTYGTSATDQTAITDFSSLWVEDATFEVPLMGGSSWLGPLQFSGVVTPGARVYCTWSYTAGYPNTLLASAVTAGATSLPVVDGTGIVPGKTQLTIYDGATTETVTVASSYTVGSPTVPLVSALANDHARAGVSVSALPAAVKQATILLTSALIRTRSSSAIVMGGMKSQPDTKSPQNVLTLDEAKDAVAMLQPFKRVR